MGDKHCKQKKPRQPILTRLYCFIMASPQTQNGYTQLANEILDHLAQTQLSGYQSRIVFAIWRKTYAWHKKEERIKLVDIKKVTKIGNISHISRAISELQERKIIIKYGKILGFNKDYEQWQKLPKLVTNVTKIGNKKLPKKVTSTSVLKKRKKLIKRKEEQIEKTKNEIREKLSNMKSLDNIKRTPHNESTLNN